MWKSKTLWAALASLIAAVASVATGEATISEGLSIGVTAILAIFLRHGISKTQDAAEDAAEAAVDAVSHISVAPQKKIIRKAIQEA
jgi:hypothetical protein